MKIRVDATQCLAYGECAKIAPELFELDEWGYAQTLHDGEVPPELESAAERAVAACPAKAISSEKSTNPPA